MTYHTNDEVLSITHETAERVGDRARLREIGQTVEGRMILGVTFFRSSERSGSRPHVLITANVHGNEVISSEVALAVLGRLADERPLGAAAELLDVADVTLIPAVNLDSRKRALDAHRSWRPFCRAPRGNANGVDLNRNFPFPEGAKDVWYPLSGTTIPWLPWYRGPHPLSEPEAKALAELCDELLPCASLSIHSVGRFFLYPYCYSTKVPADADAFEAMGRAFVAAQPLRPYRVRQSRTWYAILGDMDDWLYDRHGTLSTTVELSMPQEGLGRNPLRMLCSFNWMNPRDPAGPIENATEACLAALVEGVGRSRSRREGAAG